MLQPGGNAPLIKGGTPVRSYECGSYQALLIRDPESFGPIEYPHIMIVYRSDEDSPIMFITAEQSTIGPELMDMVAEQRGEDFGDDLGHGVFLGVFDLSGHSNLGASIDYAVLERFEVEAIAVMRRWLELHASVRVTRDYSKENKGLWERLWGR